jgi:hypothetical protein
VASWPRPHEFLIFSTGASTMTDDERTTFETAEAYREVRDTFPDGSPEWCRAHAEYQAALQAYYVGDPAS